jgi:SOS-response transcriptional repressor LexA
VRDGDHVVLVHRERAEHGDLAAVLEPDGRAHLWKVYPDADGLRLSLGHPAFERRVGANARVQGVVVAVLRRLHETPTRCE